MIFRGWTSRKSRNSCESSCKYFELGYDAYVIDSAVDEKPVPIRNFDLSYIKVEAGSVSKEEITGK